jgi:hypothetical protein
MPSKSGKVTKKSSRDSEEDEANLNQIDIQYNPDIIISLLNELAANVEIRCSQIQKDSDFLSTSIQQAFHLELIKLPNQVKQMSIKRFKEEFGFSLEAVTRGAIGNKYCSKSIDGNNQDSNRRTNLKVFETPSQRNKLASTVTARAPREGEFLLSQNGSPLGEFKTVKKAPKAPGSGLVPPTPSGIFVPLKSGEVISLDPDNVENLSLDAKKEALLKMQEMMNNMQSMMSKLSKGTTTNSSNSSSVI